MSNLLAIDASTAACSVAISRDGGIVEDFILAPQDHTRRLLPMIDDLLRSQNLPLSDISAIAFTNGPGSFTGLRICLSIVQGLAFGTNLPVIPVSTLEVMVLGAQRLLNLSSNRLVLPMLDARMAEVYWGLYESDFSHNPIDNKKSEICTAKEGIQHPICLVDDAVSALSDILKTKAGEYLRIRPCLGLGDGWNTLHSQNSKDQSGCEADAGLSKEHPLSECADLDIHSDFYPHAYDVAVLGEILFQQGKSIPIEQAKLNYLRNEISWKKRQKIRRES